MHNFDADRWDGSVLLLEKKTFSILAFPETLCEYKGFNQVFASCVLKGENTHLEVSKFVHAERGPVLDGRPHHAIG